MLKVLIADNDATSRTMARLILENHGHMAATVNTAAEALAAMGENGYEVILLDASLPDMDAVEATRRIRASKGRTARVPVVALTSKSMPGDQGYFRKAGLDGCIAKPYDFALFTHAIGRALDRRHKAAQIHIPGEYVPASQAY